MGVPEKRKSAKEGLWSKKLADTDPCLDLDIICLEWLLLYTIPINGVRVRNKKGFILTHKIIGYNLFEYTLTSSTIVVCPSTNNI